MEKKEIVEILKKLNKEVEDKYKARIMAIFGSYVRGEESSRSDIDILVEFKNDADLIHFVGLSIFLEEKLNRKVDIVPFDTIKTEIKDNIIKDAIYL